MNCPTEGTDDKFKQLGRILEGLRVTRSSHGVSIPKEFITGSLDVRPRLNRGEALPKLRLREEALSSIIA